MVSCIFTEDAGHSRSWKKFAIDSSQLSFYTADKAHVQDFEPELTSMSK